MAFHTPPINRRNNGFTLYEAVIASVVLAIAMIALCGTLTAANTMTLNMQQTATAVALGRELLEEITSCPLANPLNSSTTPVSSATTGSRSAFGYAGAYNLYTDTGSSLAEVNGTTINATNGLTYTRKVTVTLGAKPSGDSVSSSSDFGLVTVTVTTPLGQTVTLQRVLSNYSFSR